MDPSANEISVSPSGPGSRAMNVRARLEHRLRQIDRLLMQDALTRSALLELSEEKRQLLELLDGSSLHS